jgi:hypothetical protein
MRTYGGNPRGGDERTTSRRLCCLLMHGGCHRSGILPLEMGAARAQLVPAQDAASLVGAIRAQGAVIWSHGRSLEQEASLDPTPEYNGAFRAAGWDTFRLNRPRITDTLTESAGRGPIADQILAAHGLAHLDRRSACRAPDPLGRCRGGIRRRICALPRRILRRQRPRRYPRLPQRWILSSNAARVVATCFLSARKFRVSHRLADWAAGRRSSRCRGAVKSCLHRLPARLSTPRENAKKRADRNHSNPTTGKLIQVRHRIPRPCKRRPTWSWG